MHVHAISDAKRLLASSMFMAFSSILGFREVLHLCSEWNALTLIDEAVGNSEWTQDPYQREGEIAARASGISETKLETVGFHAPKDLALILSYI